MDLTPHMERLRYELGAAAAVAGKDARAAAERLTATRGSTVRLVPPEALPEAPTRSPARYGVGALADWLGPLRRYVVQIQLPEREVDDASLHSRAASLRQLAQISA
jgi:hypothetical protein